MNKKALYVLIGLLIGALGIFVAARQRSIESLQVGPDAQAIEHYDRGIENQQQSKFDLAIEEYTEAIDLDPQYAEAYYNRGISYYAKGDLDRAIADYGQAIALDSKLAEAYNNRGNAYDDKGDFDLAIANHDQAIALDPEYADAYYDRGTTNARNGDLDRAIADYDQAIALDPGYVKAYTNRGSAYASKGELDRAIADFDQAVALDPEHVSAYYNRGFAYGSKGDLDSAIADYDQTIALDPQHALAYTNRGVAHWGKGNLDRAIADFDQTIALDPEDAKAYFNRGLVYVVLGKAEAVTDLERAIELGLDAGAKQFAEEKVKELGQTATPIPPTITPELWDAEVSGFVASLHQLPNSEAPIMKTLGAGLKVDLLAVTEDKEWVQATAEVGGWKGTGWLLVDKLRLNVSLDDLEVDTETAFAPLPASAPEPVYVSLGPLNQGLSLSRALVNNAQYSIEMVFNFSDLSGYRKVIDFNNLASDLGLYTFDTALEFYSRVSGPSGAFTQDVDAHLVVTRDASTNHFIGYVDGVQQISFIDSGGDTVFTNNIIQFFKDDFEYRDEVSTGAVDRILIYDSVITPSEVTALFQGTGGPAASHIYELNGSFEDDLGGPALARP